MQRTCICVSAYCGAKVDVVTDRQHRLDNTRDTPNKNCSSICGYVVCGRMWTARSHDDSSEASLHGTSLIGRDVPRCLACANNVLTLLCEGQHSDKITNYINVLRRTCSFQPADTNLNRQARGAVGILTVCLVPDPVLSNLRRFLQRP